MFTNVLDNDAHGLYAAGLGLLGSPRLASASLALPAPRTTATPGAFVPGRHSSRQSLMNASTLPGFAQRTVAW